MILRRLLSPAACFGLSFMTTVMHSTGQARSQAWQPVQNGSSMSKSQMRIGKARSRFGISRCTVGYWIVTGLREASRCAVVHQALQDADHRMPRLTRRRRPTPCAHHRAAAGAASPRRTMYIAEYTSADGADARE